MNVKDESSIISQELVICYQELKTRMSTASAAF